jgi:hypothetical protein
MWKTPDRFWAQISPFTRILPSETAEIHCTAVDLLLFRKPYLVYDMHQSHTDKQLWIAANHRRIWRLNGDLQGQPLRIPAGPWVDIGSGTIAFLPVRPGILITSNNFASGGAAGGAGLYLLRPGTPAQRLEQGLVEEASVSPDGCRVTYGFRPRLDTGIPEGGPRLVVLDLCGAIPIAKR